ncbi:MAG: inorganic phosphate transporter [Deltaproteobacteria bacterium]|nr:MAG: inorganic phosphate transporter [Deltaproteobacteria bacterium]
MWQVASGIFLGWSLGSNDAANVFGTAVASRMVRFWTAAALCSVFVMLGALLEGRHGMETYRQLSPLGLNGAFIASLSAALTVSLMSFWRLPVSTSQAVVGALVLLGVLRQNVDTGSLTKVVLCWVGTPIGAMLASIVLYYTLGKFMNLLAPSMFAYDRGLRWLLILSGSYGAYALGANNVANVTGAFTGPGMLTPLAACLIGGGAIVLGVVTYSRRVMLTVGKDLVRLDAFTAFIAIMAEAVTVHIYAMVGVPVSTSQAVVGAVLGIGIVKSMKTINRRTLWRILFGWVGTPAIAAALALGFYELFVLLRLL